MSDNLLRIHISDFDSVALDWAPEYGFATMAFSMPANAALGNLSATCSLVLWPNGFAGDDTAARLAAMLRAIRDAAERALDAVEPELAGRVDHAAD